MCEMRERHRLELSSERERLQNQILTLAKMGSSNVSEQTHSHIQLCRMHFHRKMNQMRHKRRLKFWSRDWLLKLQSAAIYKVYNYNYHSWSVIHYCW